MNERAIGVFLSVFLATTISRAQPLRDAHPPETNAGTRVADTQNNREPPATTFSDAWPPARSWLQERGVDIAASYGSETAGNLTGGARSRVRETGQFVLGSTLDLERLIGLRGGKVQATATYRRGADLGAAADLGVLQQVQEVYGRGQTLRLTQLWYQQSLDGDHVDIKAGRLTMGEDFGAFSCQFMNLSFCGAPPGNVAGDYWYNWPVSQWALRARIKDARFYAMAGVYEVNARNLDNVFAFGYFHGASGVMLPAEVGFTPHVGARRLPGSYKFGGWYTTADSKDRSRYGFYVQLQQQLTGEAEDGPDGRRTRRGLVGFLNFTQTDHHGSTTDNQVALGAFYTGLIAVRPHDDVGVGVARTHADSRSMRSSAEHATELFYGVHFFPWLVLRPNVQLVVDPGGDTNAQDVVVLGVKGAVTL